MSFSDQEVAYLRSQRLARLATVAPDGQPDVVPVGFEFDGRCLYVGGLDPARTRKFRNVRAGNTKVALVVDDLASVRPWSPRYLRIYGTAELVERPGQFGPGPYMQITPTISWSFNLDGRSFTHDREVVPRRTIHHAADPTGSRSAPRDRGVSPPMRSARLATAADHDRGDRMSFETPTRNGTRGRRQPGTGGSVGRWLTKRAISRIRRKGKMPGLGFNALVLTTIGRKSGLERQTPVGWFPGPDGSWLIVASAAGAARNPAWYYNMAAHPDQVWIEMPGRKVAVTAEQLRGVERDEAWRQITAAVPRFAAYQQATDRELPIIRLVPRSS